MTKLKSLKKIKPKELSKTSTRITQVHGSMEAQNIVERVKVIIDEKQKKTEAIEKKLNSKTIEKKQFYCCKTECVCDEEKCLAFLLRECPCCHSILRSVFSKMSFQIDGKKPTMILPDCAKHTNTKSSRLLLEDLSQSEASEDDESSNYDYDFEKLDETNSSSDKGEQVICVLKSIWKSLCPPIKEEDIIGKWYGVIYGKKKTSLFVAKVEKWFLVDRDGCVQSIMMRCLIPKMGSGTTLKDTPKHLPSDMGHFSLADIILGPLEVIPRDI